MAGSGTGRTLIEPPDDPVHDTPDNTATVSDSETAVLCARRRPVIRSLFISEFSP